MNRTREPAARSGRARSLNTCLLSSSGLCGAALAAVLGLGLPAAAQSIDGLVEGAGASLGDALAVSGDGSVVAGHIFTGGGLQEAAVWNYGGTSWSGATSLAHGA